MTDIRSLGDAAVALRGAQRELELARRHRDELKPDFDAAVERVREAHQRVERIEQGMTAVVRAHAISEALREAEVEYDGPPLIVQPARSEYTDPQVYGLVAVGPKGTGLYLHTPKHSHRYQGKEHVIRETDAKAHGLDAPNAQKGWEYERTHEWHLELGVWAWQKRGRGQFGAGSGSMAPLPPPEGGRWKWLKIREQEALEA